ncbi:MAG: hypothetical protein A2007_03045 [Verrucomicrobia bacterium GWC2_42_7]|nr:MAG: hypothetical protein A2007_03045 [Verrucomicrobia bacterium GWC2_42_7]
MGVKNFGETAFSRLKAFPQTPSEKEIVAQMEIPYGISICARTFFGKVEEINFRSKLILLYEHKAWVL